nr:GNAT family N-acetyltransferase [Ancylobacter oerskovii]
MELYRELDPDDAGDLAEARAVFDRMGRYPDYGLYVAEAEGEVLGTFTLLVAENIAHGCARSAVIEAVAVSGAAQGRGIGRAMMGWALDRAREKGCYKAALSTRMSRERAHAFYEGLGFRRHGFSFTTELGETDISARDTLSPRPSSHWGGGTDGTLHLAPLGRGRPAGAGEGAYPAQGVDGRTEPGHDGVSGGTDVTERVS